MVQLFDFGFCRELPPALDGNSVDEVFLMSKVGSPLFMAPEIILDSGEYNLKADVYSWAVTFYGMLCLKTFAANVSSYKELQNLAAKARRPNLSNIDLPSSIKDLLQKAWRQSVTERASMKEVCTDLVSIVEELRDRTEAEDLEDISEPRNHSPSLRGSSVTSKNPANTSKLGFFWRKSECSETTELTSGFLSHTSAASVVSEVV